MDIAGQIAMLDESLDPTLDSRLHGYQRRAVAHLRCHPRAALMYEMGLGKTAISLQALQPRHLPAAVVATKRTTSLTWPTEANIWRPDLSYRVIAGTPKQRAAALAVPADLTFISREHISQLNPQDYKTIILDELSGYKTPSTGRFKAARKIAKQVEYLWGLTGTPAPNGYTDLWGQVYLLDLGERLDTSVGRYRSRYFYAAGRLPSGVITRWLPFPGSQDRINDLISDICLSMKTNDYLQLPDVVNNQVYFDLPEKVRKFYDKHLSNLVADIDNVEVASADRSQALGKLHQVTSGNLYDEDQSVIPMHRANLDAVLDIANSSGEPMIVLYAFKAQKDQLLAALPGSESTEGQGLQNFIDGKTQYLVAHPAAIGHGLNLQYTSRTIIWASLPWSLELYDQTNARLVRQGQTKTTFIHHVLARNTLDDQILQSLRNKRNVQDELMKALKPSTKDK